MGLDVAFAAVLVRHLQDALADDAGAYLDGVLRDDDAAACFGT